MNNNQYNQLIQVICSDQIKYKYKILLNGFEIQITVIPEQIIDNIIKKYKPICGFYGGSKLYPTNKIFYIFKKIQFKNSFIKDRKKYLQQIKKKQTQNFNFENRQQSISDVFRQYIGWFRYH